MGKEQRRYERFPVAYEAWVSRLVPPVDPSAQRDFPAKITDLSRGGACLETRELVYPNERVRVAVHGRESKFDLDVVGVVRWINKITGGYQVGVKFEELRKLALAPAADQDVNAPSRTPSKGARQANTGPASAPPSQSA